MTRRRVAAALASLALLLVGWGFVVEPSRLTVSNVALALPAWPRELDGVRVVVVADLHGGAAYMNKAKLEQLTARINEQDADLVLLAGDFIAGHVHGEYAMPLAELAQALAPLRAKSGVYAVLGNHDWWVDGEGLTRALEGVGIPVLENSVRPLQVRGQKVWLVGFPDQMTRAEKFDPAKVQLTDDAPALAFMHNPDTFPSLPHRFALTLAGHTHGGQVRLPLLGRPIIPSAYGQRYASGHIVEAGQHLFVTNGVGTSIMPVRFGVPPELSVLTLTHAP